MTHMTTQLGTLARKRQQRQRRNEHEKLCLDFCDIFPSSQIEIEIENK